LSEYGKSFFRDLSQKECVGFYFDDTFFRNLELQGTAREFAINGLLSMPFELCFFTFPSPQDGVDDYATEIGEDRLSFFAHKEDTNTISLLQLGKESFGGYVPILRLKENTIEFKNIAGHGGTEEQKLKTKEILSNTAKILIAALMMLNHPAYQKEKHTPDDKLQKARQKRGREKLSPYIYIKVRDDVRKAFEQGNGTVRCPHWRRGHVRRLHDGRVVAVQAHLVNFAGEIDSPDAPKPKMYIIG